MRGDLARAFAEADVILECRYSTPRQEHAYMEPEAGIAVPESDGSITICAGTQGLMQARSQVAAGLGLPEHKIRIISPTMGGSFGGKIEPSLHPGLALAALRTGRPVRMAWSSEESFLVSPKRNPSRTRFKLGARADGRILAIEADLIFDGGAYASLSPAVLQVAVAYLTGPYDVPVVSLRGRVAYTNNPISGAFRGFGGPQGCFALESTINKLAGRIGLDPAELRLWNAMREGDLPAYAIVRLDEPVTLPAVFERIREREGPRLAPSAPRRRVGRGYACAMPLYDQSSGFLRYLKDTTVGVEMPPDTSVVVRTETVDFGEGTATLLAQLVAEELQIPFERIVCSPGDSALSLKSGRSVASRQTYCMGNALIRATGELRRRLLEVAANRLKAPIDALRLGEGRVVVTERPDRGVELAALALQCAQQGIDLSVEGKFTTDDLRLGHTYSAAVVDVEVDEDTGKFWVLRSGTVVDVGRAINPASVVGQLYGGEEQGLGFAMLEDMSTENGVLLTPNLMQYLLPTSMDVPRAGFAEHVEVPSPTGPFGAKGMAEHAIKDFAPALVAAIHDGIGVWVDDLPVTPEKIWASIEQRDQPIDPELGAT